jgi:hypothetical protein
MSELRDGVERIVRNFGDETQEKGRRNPERWTDAILALVAEAMTPALMDEISAEFGIDGFLDSEGPRVRFERAITAALRVAGIVEG